MIDLRKLYKIQKTLKKKGYPDYKRVSKEILQYTDDDERLKKILGQIEKDKPWEYIKGDVEFYTLLLKVNRNVLIPRIETEKLVNLAIHEFKDNRFDTVVDIGTGSGCIITAFVKSLLLPSIYTKSIEKIEFFGTDVDSKALKIARDNIKKHKLEKFIKISKQDLISKLDLKNKRVLLLANLPYIPTEQYKDLDDSVTKYEPKKALDGGKDGNKYYKLLLSQIKKSKAKGFTLILETEESIIKDTQKIFKEFKTEIVKDIKDKDRFIIVHK